MNDRAEKTGRVRSFVPAQACRLVLHVGYYQFPMMVHSVRLGCSIVVQLIGIMCVVYGLQLGASFGCEVYPSYSGHQHRNGCTPTCMVCQRLNMHDMMHCDHP